MWLSWRNSNPKLNYPPSSSTDTFPNPLSIVGTGIGMAQRVTQVILWCTILAHEAETILASFLSPPLPPLFFSFMVFCQLSSAKKQKDAAGDEEHEMWKRFFPGVPWEWVDKDNKKK